MGIHPAGILVSVKAVTEILPKIVERERERAPLPSPWQIAFKLMQQTKSIPFDKTAEVTRIELSLKTTFHSFRMAESLKRLLQTVQTK